MRTLLIVGLVLVAAGCRTGVVIRDCEHCHIEIHNASMQGKSVPFDVARGAKVSGLPGVN